MKRDMELIRNLLLWVEEDNNDLIQPYDKNLFHEHFALLVDAGYINGTYVRFEDGKIQGVYPIGLTWEGYEFLETIRNKSILKNAIEKLKPVGSFSVPVIRELCVHLIKESIGSK